MKNEKIKVTAEVGKDTINQEQPEKINFFKKVYYSITKFEKYPDLAAQGVMKAINYLLTLMAIFAILIGLATTYQTSIYVGKIKNYIEKDLPDFTYSEEKLKFDVEEPIVEDKSDMGLGWLIIDTSINADNETEIEEYEQFIQSKINQAGIIITENEAIQVLGDNDAKYTYTDLIKSIGADLTEVSKEDALSYFSGNRLTQLYGAYFLSTFIYLFVVYLLSVFVDSLMLAVLGFITTLCAKLKMKFLAIYNMSIYALTLSILFSMIYTLINVFNTFTITYFQVMYVSIAYICLAAAIFMIKSDFVKKQAELQKINEEQKKVRDELIKQEEEKKQNKDQKDDKKEEKNGDKEEKNETPKKEKKEKKQKKDKDSNLGDTPEESNA